MRTETGTLRVLVVGSGPLTTSVWSTAIRSSKELNPVGTATSLEETIARVPECDVVLLCALTQVEAGVEWVRLITRAFPESRIMVVGIPHQEHVVLAYVEAGACAYVPEQETIESVLESLPGMVRGEAHVAPELAPALIARLTRLRQAYVEPESLGSRLEALTPREREILDLVARNLSNQEIADRLQIEIGTVKNHVHNLLDKLSMESRHQAAAHLHGSLDFARDSNARLLLSVQPTGGARGRSPGPALPGAQKGTPPPTEHDASSP